MAPMEMLLGIRNLFLLMDSPCFGLLDRPSSICRDVTLSMTSPKVMGVTNHRMPTTSLKFHVHYSIDMCEAYVCLIQTIQTSLIEVIGSSFSITHWFERHTYDFTFYVLRC